ncbi:hypothetical protein CAPTEDRAFT_219628 [Capitella teleta]|uniref:WAP domain-containing protein n=1 Tax=Capitella teleta TaxID=283909 RepID=R7UPB2_CAPTE|nr:hypothetical protein CAPTEDRAFT_219628 [Capitella teleta]|eukprot:ELU08025.1 hypothetical protein CAPTEDRAFT_219628 [Capitella teleta]
MAKYLQVLFVACLCVVAVSSMTLEKRVADLEKRTDDLACREDCIDGMNACLNECKNNGNEDTDCFHGKGNCINTMMTCAAGCRQDVVSKDTGNLKDKLEEILRELKSI